MGKTKVEWTGFLILDLMAFVILLILFQNKKELALR